MKKLAGAILLLFLAVSPALAVNPDEVLKDPALEARARALSSELRCMVCQNQSIDDSNADLAKDLRLLVRKRLVAGDSDAQVMDYLVSRYGDFVLLKPPLNMNTVILWSMPFVLFAVGGAILLFKARRRRSIAPVSALSEDEKHKLDALLKR